VRPVEQGEGDSFVAAFARASDAVACALELQRAPLAPIRLRIGVHTGEIQLRDEGNYAGPTINRTARLRDLAHGGQKVLSGATEPLVVDRLPEGAWLTDLGSHPLRDLPRPERVVQLCHPDLVNEFPPLRASKSVVSQHLPVQLTSFVGRDAELTQLRELLAQNRVVTLTGAQAALVGGDLIAAHREADDAVTTTTGWWLTWALTMRVRVAIAQGQLEQAECDAHDALACAAELEAYLGISDILECLAALAGDAGSHREAARLFGAAGVIRQRIGEVRFKVWDAGYEASAAAVRDALGDKDFDAAWAEGAALSTDEAIAYAQRGRGQRKRPTSGWASLTPTERDVVRLVSDGLANNDIATRLFVSPRTVQTHLTHVYTKLGLTSRVQLAQEAARHAPA